MRVKELFNLRHILKETVLSASRYMTVGIDNAIFVNVFIIDFIFVFSPICVCKTIVNKRLDLLSNHMQHYIPAQFICLAFITIQNYLKKNGY